MSRRYRAADLFRLMLIITIAMLVTDGFAADWPQFRGPNCSGISDVKATLPVRFSAKEGVAWSAKVGDGIGSPIVVDQRVFVSGMTGPETVSLFAFDATSGQELWRRDWETGPLPEIHASNSQASSTAAADDERVYFYFSSLGMLAVDAETGEDVWHYKLPTPFFVFKWGPGMSPTLYKDLVIFCQDDDIYPSIVAIDRRSGKLRWQDNRLDMAVNYCHPVVCTHAKGDDLVVGGTGMLIGYDPSNGQRRWHAKVLLRNIKTTPVCHQGIIYISVQSAGIANQWLASVDRADTGNNDDRLDKAEIQAFVGDLKVPDVFYEKTFDRGDLNKDGFLQGQELDVAFLHPDNFAGADFTQAGEDAAAQFIMAIRGGGEGDVTDSHILWKHKTKHTDHIVSPYVAHNRMLLVKEGGIRTIFDAKSGLPTSEPTRVGRGGSFFASPISGDSKIYLAGENGRIIVLRDDASFEELADNDMGESILATPAISEEGLFVRTRTQIFCLRAK
jgi:outer membrane protein assembly factor BamB